MCVCVCVCVCGEGGGRLEYVEEIHLSKSVKPHQLTQGSVTSPPARTITMESHALHLALTPSVLRSMHVLAKFSVSCQIITDHMSQVKQSFPSSLCLISVDGIGRA